MFKYVLSICFCIILLVNSLSGQEYPKVVLSGDYPDPSIVRVGKDYYMTHSPFIYTPGFLIWHSTDLEHWEPVCRAMPDMIGSAMAPDLVVCRDTFYIYIPSAETNWVIWATDIKGPWSKPINLHVGHIDPGHAVREDGKRYLFLSDGKRVRLTDDGLATIGKMETVYVGWDFPKEWETEGKWLESPKIIKHGQYYYLTSAEGGTAGPPTSHMVISARSKSINGPWENSPYNPIVHTYSASEEWWSKGHGTIIDDINGNWWIVYHAYQNGVYSLGRQTLIEPLEWTEDGWFKTAQRPIKALPKSKVKTSGFKLSDNFSGKDLGLQWTAWRNYDHSAIRVGNNMLYMKGKGTFPADGQLLLCTPQDTSYQVQITLDPEQGSHGGLVLFYNEKAFVGIETSPDSLIIHESATSRNTVPFQCNSPLTLRIENDKNKCSFSVSADGKDWNTLLEGLDVSYLQHNIHKGFLAIRIGLVATGKNSVRFKRFEYSPLCSESRKGD